MKNRVQVVRILNQLIRKRWLWTISSSLLILLSTYFLGYVSFKKEIELSNKKTFYNRLESDFKRSNDIGNYASLEFELAFIQKSIVNFSNNRDKKIFSIYQRVLTSSLYPILLRKYNAAGRLLSKIEIDNIEETCKRATYDTLAFNNIISRIAKLEEQAGVYRGDLIMEQAKLEKEISEIENSIISTKNTSIILQLFGLFLLLIKELLPKSVNGWTEWKNKRWSDTL